MKSTLVFATLSLASYLGLSSVSAEAGTFRSPCEAVIEKDQLLLPTRTEWKKVVDHPDVSIVSSNRNRFYVQCNPQGDLKPEAHFIGEYEYKDGSLFFSNKRRPDRSDPLDPVVLLTQALDHFTAVDVRFRKVQIARSGLTDVEANEILTKLHKEGYELIDFSADLIEFSKFRSTMELNEKIRFTGLSYTKMAELRFNEYEKLLSKATSPKEQEDVLAEFSRTYFDEKFYIGIHTDLQNLVSEGTKYNKSLLSNVIKEKFPEVITPMRKEQKRVFTVLEEFVLKGEATPEVKLKAIDALVQYATLNRLVDYKSVDFKVAKTFQDSSGVMWNEGFFAKQLESSLNRIGRYGVKGNSLQMRAKSWLQLLEQ